MRAKLFTALFMIILSFFVRAEKTYKKDGFECQVQGQKISFALMSEERYTDSEDDEYGQIIHITTEEQSHRVNLNQEYPGRYKFISAGDSFCGKAIALKVGQDQIAIFLGRDNRPFASTISVLYFNHTTRSTSFLTSKIQASSAFVQGDKAYFQQSGGSRFPSVRTEVISGKKYVTIEKEFEPLVSFDGYNFQLDKTMSYQRFEHKGFIKESDLDQLSEFKVLKYSYATSTDHRSKCLSLNNGKWNCI